MIEVRSLAKRFGEVQAVREVSFGAPDGRITGLLGPNGAGKSTTLRMLYTVLKPDGGNVRFDGELHGLDTSTLRRRVDELIERLGMQEFADRRAGGFSQGQRVKVALARALVHSPRNVLLDEPTNGLDVMATRALRDLIRGLKADGHCVLFSSHVMPEVAALCDEVVIIDHGRVAAAGTPDALQARFGGATLEDTFVRVLGEQEGLE
jgi:sodium transport system ATP-binding protein